MRNWELPEGIYQNFSLYGATLGKLTSEGLGKIEEKYPTVVRSRCKWAGSFF